MRFFTGIAALSMLLVAAIPCAAQELRPTGGDDTDATPVWVEDDGATSHLPSSAGEVATVFLAGPSIAFTLVPGGTFMMGSPDTEQNREPNETQHEVTITRDYYVGIYPVTQDQWYEVFLNHPSFYSVCGGDCPVESVTWWEALVFANAVSVLEGVQQCYMFTGCDGDPGTGMVCSTVTFVGPRCAGYRLPTEAEWERAARAGTTTRFSYGEVLECGDSCEACTAHAEHMWWCWNNDPVGTKPVGSKLANGYGLHDIHGNVFEWVWNRYGDYPAGPVTDPTGPTSGANRVSRGGYYASNARYCRSAYRNNASPNGADYEHIGFRLVRTATIFADGFEGGNTTAWSSTQGSLP